MKIFFFKDFTKEMTFMHVSWTRIIIIVICFTLHPLRKILPEKWKRERKKPSTKVHIKMKIIFPLFSCQFLYTCFFCVCYYVLYVRSENVCFWCALSLSLLGRLSMNEWGRKTLKKMFFSLFLTMSAKREWVGEKEEGSFFLCLWFWSIFLFLTIGLWWSKETRFENFKNFKFKKSVKNKNLSIKK